MPDSSPSRTPRGRSTAWNPPNRFESQHVEPAVEEEEPDACAHRPPTQILDDHTVSIISRNNSPDIGFDVSLNPYRGCEHGCAYCYARPTHEFLGYSAGLDFETRIMAKHRAPELLAEALSRPSWKPQVLAMSGVTDPYQPIERKLGITRGCLEVLNRFRHPLGIITKNALITRDRDLLARLAEQNLVHVTISVTTLDRALARSMEPRTASPRARLEAVRDLAEAGIPVGVNIAPVIPGLTDTEIPSIIEASADHGAHWINTVLLRLPYRVKDLFLDWLDRTVPGKRDRVESRIRDLRGGGLNDSRFGLRGRGEGIWKIQIDQLVQAGLRKAKFTPSKTSLNLEAFTPAGGRQLELF